MQQSFVFLTNKVKVSKNQQHLQRCLRLLIYFLLLVISYACKVHVYRENVNPTFTICAILKESLQLFSDV